MAPGIAVGGHHHVAGADFSPRRADFEPVGFLAHAHDGRSSVHCDARTSRALEHAAIKQPGVQTADVRAHRAAVVRIGPDLCVLLSTRNYVRLDSELAPQELGLAGKHLIMARAHRAGEAAGERIGAVDALVANEAGEILARGFAFCVDRPGAFAPEGIHHFTEADTNVARGDSAVAARRAFAGTVLLQHLNVASRAGERERRGQPGIPRAHHDRVAALRQGALRRRDQGGRLPPIRRLKRVRAHLPSTPEKPGRIRLVAWRSPLFARVTFITVKNTAWAVDSA